MSQLTANVRNLNEYEIELLIRNRQHNEILEELRTAPNYVFPNTGNGILHLSVKYNSSDLTKTFITLGCNVNIQNKLGNTALIDAVWQERPLQVKLLLEAKSDIYLTNINGDTALKLALKSVDDAIKFIIMKHLLDHVKNTVTNSWEIVELLKEANCSLICAVCLNNIEVIKLMLEQGFDNNSNNFYNGWTALHAAAMTNNCEMIRLLVQHGCDVNIADQYGNVPLIHMISCRGVQSPEIIRALMPTNINWTEVCHPAAWMKLRAIFVMGTKETLQLFLQFHEVNLTARDLKGMTPLHYLVSNSNDGIFDLYQNFDFDIDAYDKTFNKTALHVAATQGNVAAVTFLLAKGANIDPVDSRGRTPLFYTLARETRRDNEYKECIEILVQHGANLQLVSADEETVFGIASYCQNYFLIEPMLAHLAITMVAGKPIEPLILDQIISDNYLKKQFDSCKQELMKMKKQLVYGTVTLLKFLTDNETKVALYTRMQESFDKSMSTYFLDSDSYYYRLLQKRFDKSMKIDVLRTKAALTLNETISLFQTNHVIINHIISFLSYKDLLKFE